MAAIKATEPVYMEMVDFVASGATSEDVANFRPSAEVQERVTALMDRERESQITEQEASELSAFVELEHVFGLAKAKARLILANRT